MSQARVLALTVLLIASPLSAAKRAVLPNVDSLIERARAAVVSGNVDPEQDLAPLVERLRTTEVEGEQHSLISTIDSLGRHDGQSPATVKAYLLQTAPPVLLAVARSKADSEVRADALMALRSLDVDDAQLDEGIAIAAAAAEKSVRFRGELLADWKSSRLPRQALRVAATPEATAREHDALALIQARHASVNAYSLGTAASDADTRLVEALLDAGVDVNAPLVAGDIALGEAAGTGCVMHGDRLEARLATIDLLLKRGADIKHRDNGGNTVLVGAVQCPLPVMEKLVAAGASVTTTGSTDFSALQFAFANARWDIAEFLVAHGARVSRKAIDQIFFERPTDPAKRALLERATAK